VGRRFWQRCVREDVSDEKIWTAVTFLKHLDSLRPAVAAEWNKKD
jgi:hypothetical protein